MHRFSLLCLVCAVALAACGGSSTLTKDALQKQAETIHSAAAEGELLAADVARDRTTEPFARIHSGKLAQQAQGAARTLLKAQATEELEPERRRVAGRAVAVYGALSELRSAPTDKRVARRVERELRELAS